MRMRVLLLVGVVVAALAAAVGVFAYPYFAGPPVTVSGPSPFAGCPFGAASGSVNYPNSEVEPFVAVDPTDPNRLVGVFQQDRWNDGGAHGLIAARSSNGGATWQESWAAFSKCSDPASPYDRASDPWVTFDTAGNVYQISLSVTTDQETSAILVSKSTDHGATWGPPKTIIQDTSGFHFNDKESITGDPTRPGYVYAVWDRGAFPSDKRAFRSFFGSHAYRGYPMFSRTTDGGATWSPPVQISNQNIFTIGNQIAVLPNGDLVDIFDVGRGSGVQPSPNGVFEGVMISHDAGLTWSQPIKIANDLAVGLFDPDTGAPIRAGIDIPDIAVDRSNGTLYAVWADARFSNGDHDDIVLSRSTDGGQKWSDPVKVNQTPNGAAAFNGTVDVAADGTVQVLYYDFRNNTAAPGLPTDVWLAHSHDGGATWGAETHLDGPFDMEQAPVARGYFLGDYQGLAAIGNDALAFFSVAGLPGNSADIHAVRATP